MLASEVSSQPIYMVLASELVGDRQDHHIYTMAGCWFNSHVVVGFPANQSQQAWQRRVSYLLQKILKNCQ